MTEVLHCDYLKDTNNRCLLNVVKRSERFSRHILMLFFVFWPSLINKLSMFRFFYNDVFSSLTFTSIIICPIVTRTTRRVRPVMINREYLLLRGTWSFPYHFRGLCCSAFALCIFKMIESLVFCNFPFIMTIFNFCNF